VHALTKAPSRKAQQSLQRETNWSEVFRILREMRARKYNCQNKFLQRRLTGPMKNLENLDRAFYALEDLKVSFFFFNDVFL
jgi:hypothetical protein